MNHSTTARTFARGIRYSVIVALLAMLASLLAITQPARALPYVVTNNSDSGPGSLRQAITGANNNPGLDTITFAPATNGTPIILAGAADENGNASGDLDILDGGDLNIQGNGAANTVIDGGGIDRVFHVCPYGGCANTVTIIGVTIRNGSVVGGSGGGIRNEAGTTTLVGSTVSANTTMHGGGIWNNGTLNITSNSTIGANTATWGGGIFNETGATMVSGSTVSGNTASYKGGGIYLKTGNTTIDGSTVSANTAGNNGGGIYSKATLNVQNGSTIGGIGAGNQADNGGGIYNEYGITTVDGSAVSANWSTANGGGGIYNEATLKVQNGSTIGGTSVGNKANDDGGGIYNNQGGITIIESSDVSANTTYDHGGGIYNKATLIVQNSSTIGRAGAGNTATWGGGIYNETGGTTMVNGSIVSANTAFDGGGIYSNTMLNVQNSTVGGAVAGNQANRSGGGIYNGTGTTTVSGSTIAGNTAGYGGGITNSATLNVQNSIVGGAGAGNQADNGGGIYNETGGTATVDSSTISANAAGHGGGIYSEATLSVQNGSTIGGAGAGNTADTAGGGIYISNGTTTVDGSTISANRVTTDDGGGIYIFVGTLNVQNGSIIGGFGVGNTADNGAGGGIYNEYGTMTVTGSRILGNTAVINGGGVYNNNNIARATSVTDSCIYGNSVTSYFNSQPAQQIATGNWWGAATGPNTPGADTYGGNVDVSGHLTVPILGCVTSTYLYLPVLLK